MTRHSDHPPEATTSPRTAPDPDERRIEEGLADLAAAADLLRDLPLDDEEPGVAFDPAWPGENGT